MCVVSNVFDHYRPKIPWVDPEPFVPHRDVKPTTPILPWTPALPLDELRKLIDEFKEAVESAKVVDRLTGQKDCEDPDKAKLLERVAHLEKVIAAMKKKSARGKHGR